MIVFFELLGRLDLALCFVVISIYVLGYFLQLLSFFLSVL